MESEARAVEPAIGARNQAIEPGPFVLRTLLKDVPLSTEDAKINCVEYFGRLRAVIPFMAKSICRMLTASS